MYLKKKLSFGEPSTNPHIFGYRFANIMVSEKLDIDFESTSRFTIKVSFDVKSNSTTVKKNINVVANKKLKSTSTIVANINGV